MSLCHRTHMIGLNLLTQVSENLFNGVLFNSYFSSLSLRITRESGGVGQNQDTSISLLVTWLRKEVRLV